MFFSLYRMVSEDILDHFKQVYENINAATHVCYAGGGGGGGAAGSQKLGEE